MAATRQSRVFVQNCLIKRLSKAAKTSEKGLAGLLLGLKDGNHVHIVGTLMAGEGLLKNLQDCMRQAKEMTPGLLVVGVWFKMGQGHLAVIVKQVWKKIKPGHILEECFGDDEFLVWPVGETEVLKNQVDRSTGPPVYAYNNVDEDLTQLQVEVSSDRILDSFLLVQLQTQMVLGFDMSSKKGELKKNIEQAVDALQEKLTSELATFHVKNSGVLLHHDAVTPTSIETSSACSHIMDHIDTDDTETMADKIKSSKRRATASQPVIRMELLMQASGEKAAENGISCAPIIHHDHGEFQYVSLKLEIDVAIAVHPETTLSKLYTLLSESASRQLDLMGSNILKYNMNGKFSTPQVHHFLPSCMDHLVTVIYPEGIEEKELEPVRRNLHEMLVLPMDQPMLRRTMAYQFPDQPSHDGYLRNTHVGLPPSGVVGGEVYMVDGTYSYHHYMQDRFDDNKWGCAYRSLQTLVSWLRHQGYTEKPVPSHSQIQQALVDVGDKDKSFVGSKQWIGSTEVSYVLDSMFGVSSKILFVSSGAEMSSKGRELAVHFQTQGTPVMIGGGVLAHTILGVDFNEVTGALKFLILDPHYTGAEDIKVIQDKGWCGWKSSNFWDQKAYYNMCMPQRPAMI